MITTATKKVQTGSVVASIPVTVWLPVLLNEELQCLSVGQHDIRIYAEVVVACGILTAKIPNEIKTQTWWRKWFFVFQPRADYGQ